MNQSLKCAVIVAFVALANASPAEIQITDESGRAGGFAAAGQEFGLTAGGSFTRAATGAPSSASADSFSIDGQVFRGLRAPSSAASFSNNAAGFPDAGDFGASGVVAGGFADINASGAGDVFAEAEEEQRFRPLATDSIGRGSASVPSGGAFGTQALNDELAFAAATQDNRSVLDGSTGTSIPDIGAVDEDSLLSDAQALNDDFTFAAGPPSDQNSLLGGSTGTSGFEGVGTGLDNGLGSGIESLQGLPQDDLDAASFSPFAGDALPELPQENPLASGFALGDSLQSAAGATVDDAASFGDSLQSAAGATVDDTASFSPFAEGQATDGFNPASGLGSTSLLSAANGGAVSDFVSGSDDFGQTAGVEATEGFMSGGGVQATGMGGFEVPNDRFDAAAGLDASASFATEDPFTTFNKRGLYDAAREIGSDIRQASGDIADEVKDGVVTVKDDIRGSLREIGSDIRQASGDVRDEIKDGFETVTDDFRSHFGRQPRVQKRNVMSSLTNVGSKISQGVGYGWKQAGKAANSVRNNRLFVKSVTLPDGRVVTKTRKLAPLVAGGVGVAGALYVGSKFINDHDRHSASKTVGESELNAGSKEALTSDYDSAAKSDAASTTGGFA